MDGSRLGPPLPSLCHWDAHRLQGQGLLGWLGLRLSQFCPNPDLSPSSTLLHPVLFLLHLCLSLLGLESIPTRTPIPVSSPTPTPTPTLSRLLTVSFSLHLHLCPHFELYLWLFPSIFSRNKWPQRWSQALWGCQSPETIRESQPRP